MMRSQTRRFIVKKVPVIYTRRKNQKQILLRLKKRSKIQPKRSSMSLHLAGQKGQLQKMINQHKKLVACPAMQQPPSPKKLQRKMKRH